MHRDHQLFQPVHEHRHYVPHSGHKSSEPLHHHLLTQFQQFGEDHVLSWCSVIPHQAEGYPNLWDSFQRLLSHLGRDITHAGLLTGGVGNLPPPWLWFARPIVVMRYIHVYPYITFYFRYIGFHLPKAPVSELQSRHSFKQPARKWDPCLQHMGRAPQQLKVQAEVVTYIYVPHYLRICAFCR